MMPPSGPGVMPMMMPMAPHTAPGGAYPSNGSGVPHNVISGVNIPPYGVPMTKTSMGIPGPPQLPQGMHATNRYPIMRTEPIPAPPSQRVYMSVGVDPQNVMVNPQFMTQIQIQEEAAAAYQQQMQPQPAK
jgi:hypothetical protein